jgi:TonB family protein
VFNVLIASGKTKTPRPVAGAVASAVAHGALLTALVLGSRPAIRVATEFEQQLAEYLFPKDRAPQTGEETLAYLRTPAGGSSSASAGNRGGEGARESSGTRAATSLDLQQAPGGSAGAPDAVTQQQKMAESMGAFILLDVDSAAARDPRSAAPAYPLDLEAKGIEGMVRVRFVVDSTGRVDLSTVRVVEKTNDEFARAVRIAMPDMRFRPAYIGTKPVRQLSEQDFDFKVTVRHDPPPSKKP